MSVAARVQDSILLWENDRFEGAFLNALIAVAATSRQHYPDLKKSGDRKPFEAFLRNALGSIRLGVEFRGKHYPIETILYTWLRCELVHEGSVPIDIEFIDHDGLTVRAGGAPNYILKLSRGWFHFLIEAVVKTNSISI